VRPLDRVTVPTCIGCGAMSQVGTCERGCSEHKLELVPAGHYDHLTAVATEARIRAEALNAVADQLATRQPGPEDYQDAYRSVQQAARLTLRAYPHDRSEDEDSDQPADPTITWWCAECGGIDAPQPCLGICIWRRVEWVNAALYEQQRARLIADRDTEQRLRLLLRLVASVTPRDGQWERGWHALQAHARQNQTLDPGENAAHAGATSR
jgi:hypothetical protein